MRLPVESGLRSPSQQNYRRKVSEVLERLRISLDYTPQSWAEILKITERDYQLVLHSQKDISAVALAELAELLKLDFEVFATGAIDYQGVVARHQGNLAYLPDRYSMGAFSRKRTSLGVLQYLEQYYGWRTRDALLRTLQVSETVFQNPEELISVRFLNDTVKHLAKRGYQKYEIFGMGAHSMIVNQGSVFAHALAQCQTPMEAYEKMVLELLAPHFERNYQYRLMYADHSHCILDVKPSEELLSACALKEVASPELCSYRAGVAASVCGYLSLPLSHVTEIRCIHDGAPSCQFNIDYSRATALELKQRMSASRNQAALRVVH